MVRRLGPHKYDRRIRVFVLIAAGLGCIGRGLAYIDPSSVRNDYISLLDPLVPIQGWAIAWVTVGLALLAGTIAPVVARYAMSTAASMWAVWCLSYLWAWLFNGVSRAWNTAILLGLLALMFAVFTYLMEPPGQGRREGGSRRDVS